MVTPGSVQVCISVGLRECGRWLTETLPARGVLALISPSVKVTVLRQWQRAVHCAVLLSKKCWLPSPIDCLSS